MPLALLAATAVAGSWHPTATLAGPYAVSSLPEPPVLAVGPAGTALAAWDTAGRIEFAVRPAGGRWSRAYHVPRATGGGVAVALGADGTAALAWSVPGTEFTPARIEASVAAPGGRFGAPVAVAEGSAAELRLAVAADGTVALTWLGTDGLALATLDAAGPSAPVVLAASAAETALCGDPDGSLLVAWSTAGEVLALEVLGGVVSAPVPVSGGGAAWGVSCARSAAGGGVVSFVEDDAVVVATESGGGFTSTVVAAPADPIGWAPSVDVDDAGDALVGWQTLLPDGSGVAWWARSAAGIWGAPRRLSSRTESAGPPRVAVTGDGLVAGAAWVDDLALGARAAVEDRSTGSAVGSRRTLGPGTWGGVVPVAAEAGVFAAAFAGPVAGNPNAAAISARAFE